MKTLWMVLLFLLYINSIVTTYQEKTLKRLKRHHTENSDTDLRRSKRSLYQALLKKKYKEKRSTEEEEEGVDIDERSLIKIPSNAKRPYQKQQVQDVQARIEVIHEWRDEMLNKTSPEYELLAGNIIDAVANELVADLNYISSSVSKLTKTKSRRKIIADVAFRFFKTEDDPVLHIQGIISKGWISGQQVDPNYFKLIKLINGNDEKSEWHYPSGHDVNLRVLPAMLSPSNKAKQKDKKVDKPITKIYKEIRISIKLKQRYDIFLEDSNSPEFSELSGNVEQAISKIFVHDQLYIEAHVTEFKESGEGRVVVHCAIRFRKEEKYAIEKCQAMISSGDLAGMPVDEQYFVIDGISQTGTGSNKTEPQSQVPPKEIPQPQPIDKKHKPKPLQYKELRVSIKFVQPWNISFSDNKTKAFSRYGGIVEQAVDRGLDGDPNYIDVTTIDFLQSNDDKTIANIAVRFYLNEDEPEGKIRKLIKNGELSGLPVDKTFFYVFSLSEVHHPLGDTTSENKERKQNGGQTGNKPNILSKTQNLRPSTVGLNNGQNPTKVPVTMTTASVETTVNPYLPKNNEQIPSVNPYQPIDQPSPSTKPAINQANSVSSTLPGYLDSSQGTVNSNPEGFYPSYNYPYIQNAEQSWYPYTQPRESTYNPYLPKESQTPVKQPTTYNPYLPVESLQSNIVAQSTTVVPPVTGGQEETNDIEGSMTLEQSWHPYLSDKSSQVYKILEQTVVAAIKNVYAQVNEEVIPNILGFSETDIPSNSAIERNEKKVAVRFKVSFLPNHQATSKPLEDAVASKSVAGILIYQNSLVIAASSNNPVQNGSKASGKPITICQKQQKFAESATEGPIGGFVPQCKDDGSYKPVQCHALTGFCWCVNKAGVRLTGTEERYKQPNCAGIKLSGKVNLPEHAPVTLLPGSCLTLFVQEMILCGGDIDCHIPVITNRTIKNITIQHHSIPYELTTTRLKTGRYILNAVINVGWCRVNSLKTSEQIHPGDYHSTIMHDFTVQPGVKDIQKDIDVEFLKVEETGTRLHGNIVLPDDHHLTSIPEGSCLSIQTKLLNLCTGVNCKTTPSSGKETIRELELTNNKVAYSMQLPELEPGTYVISTVLHIGQCPESEQSMVPGDYYNDEMYDYTVSMETTDIEKDVKVVELKSEVSSGTSVTGRVVLPTAQRLPSGSCLTVSSRKLIQCKHNNCKIPPVATKTFENVQNEGGIPYTLSLPVATSGAYIISAVINLGWCKSDDGKEWIKPGDFYNEQFNAFQITNDTTVVEKNIDVKPFVTEQQKTGVTVHGRVILPAGLDLDIPSNSCLTIKAQEHLLCGGLIKCSIPISAKETYHTPQLKDNVIPYAIVLPNVASGHYVISAVLNVGWCKDNNKDSDEWIRSGDFHNEEYNDFMISDDVDEVEKDIEVTQYIVAAITGPPEGIEPSVKPSPEVEPTTTEQSQPTVPYKTTTTTKIPYQEESETATTSAPFVADTTKADTTTTITTTPPNEMTTRSSVEKVVVTTRVPSLATTKQPTTSNNKGFAPNKTASSDELITLPKGLPKSCQEIRDAGIGNMDGQYVIEARTGCHLSIICQGMDRSNPKEFLGGPSEDEWKYWHYAVLIKISSQDKQNIPTGACLENSDAGKDLLQRILIAGSKQENPISQWKTNIAKLLRSRRNVPQGDSLITKAKTIYKGKNKRSSISQSEWGVL